MCVIRESNPERRCGERSLNLPSAEDEGGKANDDRRLGEHRGGGRVGRRSRDADLSRRADAPEYVGDQERESRGSTDWLRSLEPGVVRS